MSPAFSLLELMIAIMILGIGVVMVATVFPVGIEMSRQPIQTYLGMAITDTAVATLQAKVPAFRELDQIHPNMMLDPVTGLPVDQATGLPMTTNRVLVPDVTSTDLDADMGSNAENQKDFAVVSSLFLYPTIAYSYPNWQPAWAQGYQWNTAITPPTLVFPVPLTPPSPPAQTVPEFISRTRVFTEHTGWSGEVNSYQWAGPVPSQNLPADPGVRTTMFPSGLTDLPSFINAVPTIVAPSIFGTPSTDLPRVSLVDQVYPPITLTTSAGADRPWADVRDELLFQRFYSWMAFHHRVSTENPTAGHLPTNRDILVTIAALHRTDVGARFARQETLDKTGAQYLIRFDLNTNPGGPNFNDHYKAIYQPQADPNPATDAVFPRPWLAAIYTLNPQNGQARVTPELARLLPVGSYMIVAWTSGANGAYIAGTPIQVTRNDYDATKVGIQQVDPANLGSFTAWTTIEVARSGLPAGKVAGPQPPGLPVWVFPPAVTNLAGTRSSATAYEFAARSPVVGVDMRRIPVR